MSPRFPSAITSSPASRASAHARSKARKPAAPSASKNASCGLTATACGSTASTMPRQNRSTAAAARASRSSGGSSSGRGSRPTTSWLRFASTAAATRSPKSVVTVAVGIERRLLTTPDAAKAAHDRRARPSPESSEEGLPRPLALDRLLQLATGRELRHGRRRDRHLLARVAWVDALALRPLRRAELPEPGERHVAAALQGLRHRLEERVDRLGRLATTDTGLRRDTVHELLLRH